MHSPPAAPEILRREDRSDTDVPGAGVGRAAGRDAARIVAAGGAAARRRGPRRGRRRGRAGGARAPPRPPARRELRRRLRPRRRRGVPRARRRRDEHAGRPRRRRRRPHARADPRAAGATSSRRTGSSARDAGGDGWARPELLGRDLDGRDARPRRLRADRPAGREAGARRSGCGSSPTAQPAALPLDELLALVRRRLAPRAADGGDARPDLARAARACSRTARRSSTPRAERSSTRTRSSTELVSGRISAGLDVFADEPRVPERCSSLPNVVLTPHIASATVETRAAMTRVLVDNVLAYSRGEPLPKPVAGGEDSHAARRSIAPATSAQHSELAPRPGGRRRPTRAPRTSGSRGARRPLLVRVPAVEDVAFEVAAELDVRKETSGTCISASAGSFASATV